MKCCKDCKHFKDGHYSRVYITPRCTQRGDDDCAYMRQHVCTLDGTLYEPTNPETREGTEHGSPHKQDQA